MRGIALAIPGDRMDKKKLAPEAGKLTNPRVPPGETNPPSAGGDYRLDQRHPDDKDGNAEQAKKPRTGSAVVSRSRKKGRASATRRT